MAISNQKQTEKIPPVGCVFNKTSNKKYSDKKIFLKRKMLQKLFHPDYILFDWEYFSRELEFE